MNDQKTIRLIRHARSAAQDGAASSDPGAIPLTDTGYREAVTLAEELSKPDLIVVSAFLRTRQSAAPLSLRFPDVPVEIWPVHEFTYLAPERCSGMTAAERRPMVDEYWSRNDPDYIDGDGAESFSRFTDRACDLAERCMRIQDDVIIYSHCLFMQMVRIIQGSGALEMTEFRQVCISNPIGNLQILELYGVNRKHCRR